MSTTSGLALLACTALLATGCAGQRSASPDSGVVGLVHLGPTCPVERQGQDCGDRPAPGAEVTVAQREVAGGAGQSVATGTTGSDGRFRIDVAPGTYVVTADAGMSCRPVDVTVTANAYVEVDVSCDTGIR